MRGNIIEEMYYGNIDPQDHGYCPKSTVKKASDSLNDLEEKLTEQLAGENKELFLRFCVRRSETTAGPLKSDTLTAENRHPFRWSDSWRNWRGDRHAVSPHAVCFIP